jgi:NAD-dependent DNA ligase
MNMFGLDQGVIGKLMDAGVVTSIASLYTLTINDICKVEGFKTKSAENILKSIRDSSKDVPLHRWLGAFPMNDVGSRIWLSLLNQWGEENTKLLHELIRRKGLPGPIEQIVAATWYRGLGGITVKKMIDGITVNKHLMEEIYPYLTFVSIGKTKPKVCVSGTRSKVLEQNLIEQGYEPVYNLTNDCTHLLTTSMTSSKAKKAENMGKTIIVIDKNQDFTTFTL